MTKMFAVVAMDKPNHLEKRMQTRPAHLQYWQDKSEGMVLAGPFLDDEGQPVGSMMVVTADSKVEAQALVDGDPYVLEGVFGSVEITPWNWVIKRPSGL